MNQPIVNISHLCRSFDNKEALKDINFTVEKGQVFGIVGENGAGKTTLIKHILGLYRAQKGQVRIFGMDPVKHPEKVLAKIGYLSEEPELPLWMTVEQILNYNAAFYENWDTAYADQLIESFRIDRSKKIKALSKGQKARVGLCLAQAYRPDLLLLDEPSSGLDPNVRRDILLEIINTVCEEGRSVIFSSHLLEEVERVSDHLLMLSHGEVLLSDSMESVLLKHFKCRIQHNDNNPMDELLKMNGLIHTQPVESALELNFFAEEQSILEQFQSLQIELISHRKMTFNEIFRVRSQTISGDPS